MSLILEALKKSEAERRVGQPPGLLTQLPGVMQARRTAWPWFGLLLVPVLVGAAWWFGRVSAPLEPAEPESDSVAMIEPTPAPAQQREPEPAEVAAAPAAAPRPSPRAPAALRTAPPTISPEASGERETAAMSAAEGELMLPSLPAPLPSPGPSQPAAALPGAAAARVAAPAPAPGKPPASSTQSELPELRDFDIALRADLPPLRASMHVYDADPARRFVLIDGRRVSEGDVLGESLFLIEIRRDGSVLEFRGRRFLLPRPG